jgi:hypothetical protein
MDATTTNDRLLAMAYDAEQAGQPAAAAALRKLAGSNPDTAAIDAALAAIGTAAPVEDPLMLACRAWDQNPTAEAMAEVERLWMPRRIGGVTGALAAHLLAMSAAGEGRQAEQLIAQVEALIADADADEREQ